MSSESSEVAQAVEEILFGSIAGMTAKLFEHPFDLVKVRLQSQPTDRPATFKGPVDCFRQTYGKEGFKGLYRGISAPIVGAAFENATLFLTYANLQRAILALNPGDEGAGLSEKARGKQRELSLGEKALAGAGAGTAASFVLTPIELIKCRMQVQMLAREGAFDPLPSSTSASSSAGSSASRSVHTSAVTSQLRAPARNLPPPQGALSLVAETIRMHGVRGLWLGQTGTLLRETGGSAAWFGAYEFVSSRFVSRKQAQFDSAGRRGSGADGEVTKKDLATWQLMLSGAAAGTSYTFTLFPADSVKSAVQTWAELHPNEPRLGFVAMAKRIWHTRGLRGLYAGCGMTCCRSAPSSAMIFAIYETLSQNFGGMFG